MPAKPDTESRNVGRHILLVEDSPTQALSLLSLLKEAGHQLEHVGSAEAALPALNRKLPHLLIVDHHLPGMQGGDLCRLVRLHLATLSMPILMLTADETPLRLHEGLDSGADDFLPKSADPSILLLRVNQLLRHARGDDDPDMLPQTWFRQPRVLLVGVDPAREEALRTLLMAKGCQVSAVAGAAPALMQLADGTPDVMVVNERLPDLDGLDLCRQTRASVGTNMALILLLDGRGDRGRLPELLDAGIDDLFEADSPLPTLRARLRALLRRRFLEEQNRRLLADFKEQDGRTQRLEAERNAARTRAVLADQLAAMNRRLADQALVTATITRNVPAALVLTDRDGVATYLNPPAILLLGSELEGDSVFGKLGVVRGQGAAVPAVSECPATLRRPDGQLVPVVYSITPLDGNDGPSGAVVLIIDVTERRQAEERQALLMAELSHRVKNTLATVLSIGKQTRRRHTDAESFWRSFEGRLRALSETHNLLADHFWEWVLLHDIIRHEVTPYAQEPQDVRIDGPAVELRPKAALALALVFHELATNAAKYGAFSQAGGRLEVFWTEMEADPPRIRLSWKEHGGPPTTVPATRGFGTTLIQRSLAYELLGVTRLLFEADGLRCDIEFSISDLIRRRGGA